MSQNAVIFLLFLIDVVLISEETLDEGLIWTFDKAFRDLEVGEAISNKESNVSTLDSTKEKGEKRDSMNNHTTGWMSPHR